MTITLYQFPISHYCEKVRWALDYKGVSYRIKNLLPGQHVKFVRSVAAKTHVPVIECDGEYVQGSAAIISWLDEHFPEKPLTPADPLEREQALEWERFADEVLGGDVRRWSYFTLLDYPGAVLPMLTTGVSMPMRMVFRVMFPKVRELMQRVMKIYPEESQKSAASIDAGLHKLQQATQENRFLAGNQFSRADLAVSAILSPFFMPAEYGVKWPRQLPQPLRGWIDARRDKLAWPEQVYREFRKA